MSDAAFSLNDVICMAYCAGFIGNFALTVG